MTPLATLVRPLTPVAVEARIPAAEGSDDLREFEAGAGRRTIDDAELRLYAEWRARRARL